MKDLELTTPRDADRARIDRLLRMTIIDTFRREGVDLLAAAGDIDHEIGIQQSVLHRFLANDPSVSHYLIASDKSQPIATAAVGTPDEIIREHLPNQSEGVLEIKSMYVLPVFQGRGIGTRLFEAMVDRLLSEGMREYCLDSGYRTSQAYWTHRLGPPTVTLPDKWAPGAPHMIWHRRI